MTSPLRTLLAPLTLSLLLASGCASHAIKVDRRPGSPLPAQAIAVFPFDFRWEAPAWRSYELSQLLALQILETNRYAVFGPGEFKLIRGQTDNPFLGSDLVLSIADQGYSPMAAVVIRPSAERRAHSELKQLFDAAGKPKGTERIEHVTLFARLEAFHSQTRERVATVQANVEIDPFAVRDGSDPLPELTALLRAMAEELLEALEERAPGEPIEREAGFDYLWNPKAGLDFALEGKPSLRQRLAQSDPLQSDILLEAQLRFFLPELDPRSAALFRRLPGGLWVTEASARAASAGLRAGDLIVSVGDDPALPQSLHRALRRLKPGTALDLLVERGPQRLRIRVPAE